MIMNKDNCEGRINVEYIFRDGRTVASKTYHEGNSRVSASVITTKEIPANFFIATGGGFVEGEHYIQDVACRDGAHAVLAAQAPTYVYKCDYDKTTTQACTIEVGENATLEYYLDEVIPYANSKYLQETRIDLKDSSTLIMTDGLTSGWASDGTEFAYKHAGLKTHIYKNGELILNDFLYCDPRVDGMRELGFYEGYTNFNTITCIDPNLTDEDIKKVEEYLKGADKALRVGLTRLENHGILIRIMGPSFNDNRSFQWDFINFYRIDVKNYPLIHLRKTSDMYLK